jgi:F0F1-type ATP synthase delta subunit
MKTLKMDNFKNLGNFINENARPLEKAIFNHIFHEKCEEKIFEELKKFQNSDGGFGNGLEADFRLPDSSSMATTIAFEIILLYLKDFPKADLLIEQGINYFENSFNYEINRWFTASKKINDYPHAPWWNFDEEKQMTVIDETWGNQNAEIIGYLLKYNKYVSKINTNNLLEYAFEHLNNMEKFEEHEIYCYIRLFNILSEEQKQRIRGRLTEVINKIVCIDEDKWKEYVPTPLNFIDSIESEKFGIDEEVINKNLDFIISNLEEKGFMNTTWQWGAYEEEWKKAKKEWEGVLTLNALIKLKNFNRIK